MKSFAVCFRGGMAKGAGAIGFVRFLQEENLTPIIYAGSSSGSLISAGYALGFSWEKILDGFQNASVYGLMDFKNILTLTSLISKKTFEQTLVNFAGEEIREMKIEDMPNKFIALSSNLKKGSLEYIQKGRLLDALMYSCSYPLVVERRNKYKIDGDFLFDYSNDTFKKMGAKTVIGCGFNLKKHLGESANPIWQAIDTYRMVQYRLYDVVGKEHKPDFEIVYNAYDVGFFDLKDSHKLADRVYKYLKKHKAEFYKILED